MNVRYIVVDFVKYKEKRTSYLDLTIEKEKEDIIEAKNLNEARELLSICSSPNAYILDKASGKKIR